MISDWIETKQENHDSTCCCVEETHFGFKYTKSLEIKGWEKICHANSIRKKTGMATLIANKIDFKTKIHN